MAERLRIPLEPVDSLTITTVVDNVFDIFMPDQAPARRASPASGG
jgi:7,8-dihydropterin-6-yl-methyl-4-(beta-D-ribofuranosyl)aminobenzene 5'-phosphate synthase